MLLISWMLILYCTTLKRRLAGSYVFVNTRRFFRKFACLSYFILWSVLQGADKSLARPDWKKMKGRHFESDAEVIAAAETWFNGQPSGLFLSGLQKLEFVRCSLFPSWSG